MYYRDVEFQIVINFTVYFNIGRLIKERLYLSCFVEYGMRMVEDFP